MVSPEGRRKTAGLAIWGQPAGRSRPRMPHSEGRRLYSTQSLTVQGQPMDIAKDLARIALQEERLRFERFDAGIAWQIGSWLRNAAVARGQSIAIDIVLK